MEMILLCLSTKPADQVLRLLTKDILQDEKDISIYWPRGNKTFSILNSAKHKIYPAH